MRNNSKYYIPSGKGSLIVVCEMLCLHTEGVRELEPEHEKELRKKMMSTLEWMKTKGWDNASLIGLLYSYKRQILKANGLRDWEREDYLKHNPQADILVNCSDAANRIYFSDDEYRDAYQEYQDELEYITTKSMRSVEAKLSWYDKKLYMLNTELKLHDIIQDVLDTVPMYGCRPYVKADEVSAYGRQYHGPDAQEIYKNVYLWKKAGELVRKAFQLIDNKRKQKKLSYTAWFLFNNQLLEKIGEEQREFPYGEIRYLPDIISYYENLKEEARQKIASEKPLVVEAQLPSDGYVDLHDEIEVHECSALVLAQTE